MKTVANFDRIGEENAFAVLARATALAAQGRDIINLGIGQPDFRTPEHIVEAAAKALRDGHHGYTPANGILPLREAVSADLHKRFGATVSPDDVMIMPGVRVRRTGGHTPHHQMILIESGGKTAAFVADLIPTTAHLPDVWGMGYDLYPLDTMAAKQQFAKEAIEKKILVFFEHDPVVAAGYLAEEKGKRGVI